jgi:molecular chaperone DnaJ
VAVADDYYALLGIARNASASTLRSAWRKLARQWHPDRAGAGATPAFQKLLAAYTVLADPVARAKYDRRLGHTRRSAKATPTVMLQRLSGGIKGLLACGAARYAEAGVIELFLNADELAHGGMITIAMRVAVHCPACASDRTAPCDLCAGRRTIDDLFSAWLAVPPDAADGDVLAPSALIPGMVEPVSFRIRAAGP